MTLTIHPHLAPRLKKEYSYTSTPNLDLCGLLQGELYLYLYLHMLSSCEATTTKVLTRGTGLHYSNTRLQQTLLEETEKRYKL